MKRFLLCCALSSAAATALAAEDSLRTQLERAVAAEDKPSALELRRRLLASGGADAGALRDLVAGFVADNDSKRALAVLEASAKAAKLAPAVENELRGDIAAAQGKDADAIALWEKSLADRPGTATAGIAGKLADAAKRSGKPEITIRALRKVVGTLAGPQQPKVRMQLAMALLQNGEFEEAVREGQAASKLAPAEEFVKASLPTIETLQRALPAVTAALAKSRTSIDPFIAQLESGALYAAVGAIPAARRAAEAALKAYPESMGALLLRGYCLRLTGGSDEAEKLGVAPIPDAGRFISRLLPALLASDVTLRKTPDAAAYGRRAANLLAAGQQLRALSAAEEALKADPKSGIGALIAGQASSQLGRRADAVRYAKLATENAPRDAEAWNFSAQLQRRRTDFRGAVESFTQALALAPRDVDSLKGREACLRTLGRDLDADRDRETWVQLTAPKPPAPGKKS